MRGPRASHLSFYYPISAIDGVQTFKEVMAVQYPIQMLRKAMRLGVIMLLLAVFTTPQLMAQSVRPPGNAVNITDGTEPGPSNALGDISDTTFWDNYRGGNPKELLAATPEGQVMSTTGQQWRVVRERIIRKYLGWMPVISIGILLIYFLARGQMRITAGRSGKTIPRFSRSARMAHWFMAGVFITLGVTGLTMLLGRPLIAPVLGLNAHAILARSAMWVHNYVGPLFIVALLWMFVKFVRGNFFHWVDFQWIFRLGGLFGGHVSSRRFNFGEKSWFWLVIIFGSIVSVTGVLMLLPWLVEDVRWLQLSTILHATAAVTLVAVALGHIYVGSIGMEGSLDSMRDGEVDENWAKEHHDLWYEEVTGKSASEKET